MQERMKNVGLLMPEAMKVLQTLGAIPYQGNVPAKTLGLVHLRASQINGCSVCIDMHRAMANKQGESQERLFTVAAWRDTPYFDDAERAALALTEAVTRLADHPDPVPDAIWNEAARHYDEKAMACIVLAIATVNVFNRLNVATRQIAGKVAWAET